jgi:FK506-binding nuclear protein
MVIVEPGTGPNPKKGDFIRVKQFIYLDNLTIVKQERVTYTFGRKKLIPGLEFCLAMCREGFKGRFYINYDLAYGPQTLQGIPANSNLVLDIEINAITP